MTRNFFSIKIIVHKIFLGCPMILLGIILISCNQEKAIEQKETIKPEKAISAQDKVIMAVFAHPDDEISIGPILTKYAREGSKVYLVTATDGRYGTGQTDLKPGEELVELRKKEVNCSASYLGIEKPIWLGYHDQLKLKDGFFGHVPYIQNLMRELDSLVSKIQPDVIITFGPDGGSNHMDHRLVGASISQIYLSKIWKKTKALYYVATPSSYIDSADTRVLRGVDDSYLTTQISYTEEDRENTIKALQCYKSQYSEESMNKKAEKMRNRNQTIYLRRVVRKTKLSNTIFE
ncbi:MAG: PIG-L family deacetylase [Flavobacteriaceae bacterium]